MASAQVNGMIVVPMMLLTVLKLIYDMLGVAMFAGVVVLLLALVSSARVMKKLKQLRRDQLKLTDARVKATNEALLAIRVVQSNSWETAIGAQIGEIRAQELALIRKQAFLQAYVKFLYFAIQVMVALSTFVTFAALGGILRASDIFSCIALFALMQRYLNNIPGYFGTVAQTVISGRRLKDFLTQPEHRLSAGFTRSHSTGQDNGMQATGRCTVRNGEFLFPNGVVALSNVQFAAENGQLVGIVGSVGSGKSSLLAALLGELQLSKGAGELHGSVALCTQQAWLTSGTVRENVIFMREYLLRTAKFVRVTGSEKCVCLMVGKSQVR